MQLVENAIARLFDNYRVAQPYPIVGRVYVVTFRRAGSFEAIEMFHVFD